MKPRSPLEKVKYSLTQKMRRLEARGLESERKQIYKLRSKIARLEAQLVQPRLL